MDLSYDERQERKARDEWIKSDYYAALARHNFEVYNAELKRVRNAILRASSSSMSLNSLASTRTSRKD